MADCRDHETCVGEGKGGVVVAIISASATVREHHQWEVAAGDCGEWRHVVGDIP